MAWTRTRPTSPIRSWAHARLAYVTNDGDPREAYREAWEAWQAQLRRLHAYFLDGERIEPPVMKGLLNREARAK